MSSALSISMHIFVHKVCNNKINIFKKYINYIRSILRPSQLDRRDTTILKKNSISELMVFVALYRVNEVTESISSLLRYWGWGSKVDDRLQFLSWTVYVIYPGARLPLISNTPQFRNHNTIHHHKCDHNFSDHPTVATNTHLKTTLFHNHTLYLKH